jgi:hypothetical protein
VFAIPTANNQMPYVFSFFDLQRGPMVLEVPPASDTAVFFGSGIDSWEVPLADVGPTGEDAGKGGKYAFLPPDYGGAPPDGYFAVPSPTMFVHFALRPIAIHGGTLQDAVAYSQTLTTYPLADAAQPRSTRYLDAYPLTWKTLPPFDLTYLRLLDGVIQADPPQPKDAAMLALLASIGIEKGAPFEPDVERAQILTNAVQEAAAYMRDSFMNHALIPFWPNRQWLGNRPESNFGFTYYGDGQLDYDRRATAFAFWATWAPKRVPDSDKMPAPFCLKCFRDASGEQFRGDRMYPS